MATLRVKVTYGSGQPTKGSKVVLAFHGLSRGVTNAVYTDANGYATFHNTDPGRADVIVDGTTRATEYMENGKEVHVSL